MNEIGEKIKSFLGKMQLKYKYNEDENVFILPFRIQVSEGFVVATVFVRYTDEWVLIVSPLIAQHSIPSEVDRKRLYERLLMDTYYLNEVTYGLTKEGDIVVHAEIHKSALEFNNFATEFNSVIYGIKHFVENIMKDFEKYKDKTKLQYL
ncbi:MAG: hypothetical protein DRJ63_07750 [Thermoprotei archaeon]|nr:MAG: hypothetical protein DRJ63_07750 [Thermoprotei archaeon]